MNRLCKFRGEGVIWNDLQWRSAKFDVFDEWISSCYVWLMIRQSHINFHCSRRIDLACLPISSNNSVYLLRAGWHRVASRVVSHSFIVHSAKKLYICILSLPAIVISNYVFVNAKCLHSIKHSQIFVFSVPFFDRYWQSHGQKWNK